MRKWCLEWEKLGQVWFPPEITEMCLLIYSIYECVVLNLHTSWGWWVWFAEKSMGFGKQRHLNLASLGNRIWYKDWCIAGLLGSALEINSHGGKERKEAGGGNWARIQPHRRPQVTMTEVLMMGWLSELSWGRGEDQAFMPQHYQSFGVGHPEKIWLWVKNWVQLT